MSASIPSLPDLYQLMAQLELDKDLPVQSLRERDHAIGAQCKVTDDAGRLMFWLRQLSSSNSGEDASGGHGARDPWLTESAMAYLARIVVFVLGVISMSTFLLSSGRGLVNVFMFLLLFVLVQLALCAVGAVVVISTARGRHPVVLPVNPARFIVSRLLPDRRYFREAQSLVRLVLLRYGQELGAFFTLGAVASFFIVLGLAKFTFVWGSTFSVSDGLVEGMTSLVAAPWSSWMPQATVPAQVIADSRFHPAVTDLSIAELGTMSGWWPFLIMAMVSYALLPRLLLWAVSRYLYRHKMKATFTGLPGCELVLARMKSPLVRTQGEASGLQALAPPGSSVRADERLLLLNWANALGQGDSGQFEQLFAVPDRNILHAGLGSATQELEHVRRKIQQPMEHLYVAVKSWEPPMADLADFLSHLAAFGRCTLFLVPLANRAISADKLDDWRRFARTLQFEAVDVMPLKRA